MRPHSLKPAETPDSAAHTRTCVRIRSGRARDAAIARIGRAVIHRTLGALGLAQRTKRAAPEGGRTRERNVQYAQVKK